MNLLTRTATGLGLAAVAGVASAGSATVYTDTASFLANVEAGYFYNDFSDTVGGPIPALNYSSNGFAYTVDTGIAGVSGLYNDPGLVSTDNSGDAIVVTFTGAPVTAVGGNFWASDVAVLPTGTDITITLSDGANVTYTSTGPSDFRGFISNTAITSITIDAPSDLPNDGLWATMDNLYVGTAIPAPGAMALLGVAGLGAARRRR